MTRCNTDCCLKRLNNFVLVFSSKKQITLILLFLENLIDTGISLCYLLNTNENKMIFVSMSSKRKIFTVIYLLLKNTQSSKKIAIIISLLFADITQRCSKKQYITCYLCLILTDNKDVMIHYGCYISLLIKHS